MESSIFHDYKKRQLYASYTDRTEKETNDKFHNIKKDIESLVSPEKFEDEMRSKADYDKFKQLEKLVEDVNKMTKLNKTKVEEHFVRFDGI